MWDYDKLFAEGNIVGLLYPDGEIVPVPCKFREESNIENLIQYYGNKDLKCEDYKIQYIIHLDEHGNVTEKLFDRERDMPKPMPKLETGMFVRVGKHKNNVLGFIDAENNHIIYQDGNYDFINSDGVWYGVASAIIEVYGKDTLGFRCCRNDEVIWRSPEYQTYLDSKSN